MFPDPRYGRSDTPWAHRCSVPYRASCIQSRIELDCAPRPQVRILIELIVPKDFGAFFRPPRRAWREGAARPFERWRGRPRGARRWAGGLGGGHSSMVAVGGQRWEWGVAPRGLAGGRASVVGGVRGWLGVEGCAGPRGVRGRHELGTLPEENLAQVRLTPSG